MVGFCLLQTSTPLTCFGGLLGTELRTLAVIDWLRQALPPSRMYSVLDLVY